MRPSPAALAPVASEWTWQLSARCRDEDPSTFFSPEGERGYARLRRQHNAKAICAQCEVVLQCRYHSLRHQEPFGVWGGLTESERAEILSRVHYIGPGADHHDRRP